MDSCCSVKRDDSKLWSEWDKKNLALCKMQAQLLFTAQAKNYFDSLLIILSFSTLDLVIAPIVFECFWGLNLRGLLFLLRLFFSHFANATKLKLNIIDFNAWAFLKHSTFLPHPTLLSSRSFSKKYSTNSRKPEKLWRRYDLKETLNTFGFRENCNCRTSRKKIQITFPFQVNFCIHALILNVNDILMVCSQTSSVKALIFFMS